MTIRFYKFSIGFLIDPTFNEEIDWQIGIEYWDGGLLFVCLKYQMRFDWGYYHSEWSMKTKDLWPNESRYPSV